MARDQDAVHVGRFVQVFITGDNQMRHTVQTFPESKLLALLRAAQRVVELHDSGSLSKVPDDSVAIGILRDLVFTPEPPPKSGVTIDHTGSFV